jgi:A/G-specific adenine glycosylase
MDSKNLPSLKDVAVFRDAVYSHYHEEGRSFPWREDLRPWGILISEFMLQQTQTARVLEYWPKWIEKWPSPQSFYEASMEEALSAWGGLGYNRRCYHLKDCARRICDDYGGQVPNSPGILEQLPGIGSYTARAVPCFAYNIPTVFIETNIRAAILHFFFQNKTAVKDKEIIPILHMSLNTDNPRVWYWALMDYGAALKKLTPNPNRRSAHYARQSPFAGSFRQLRGAVLRTLVRDGPTGGRELRERSGIENEEDLYRVLESLKKENMVAEREGVYRIYERT